ncbi:MAG: alpha/beta hydrolase [Nocardioides sp.]
MTTITLPPVPRPIPALTVDPGGIRACGADLLAASANIDDVGTFVAGDARIGDWTGVGSSAYHGSIAPIGQRADAMSLALRGVARRVEAHAEEMQSLETRRGELDELRGYLVQQTAVLRAQASGATEEDAAAIQADCDEVTRQVRVLETDIDTWTADVATEESEMNEAFARVQTLDQVEREYGGVADPADAALATKPPVGASPAEVNAWWDGLTQEQQDAIVAASPGAIGNLDGIPATARDGANTVALDRDLAELEDLEDADLLTGDERTWLENARAADEARDRIEGGVDPVTGEPIESQIYIYDPAAFNGDGRIAIAAGNLDTADNVAVTVPGFGTDSGSAPLMADRAMTIYESTRFLDPSQSNATMFWIGYDAPENVGTLSESMAAAGGERLADTIDGLRASRDGEPAHLTALGHSYGSTTVGLGAENQGLDVDDIIFVGSPGVGGDTDHASDTGIDPDHVWAGANSRDVITYLGNHGSFHGEVFGGAGLGDDPAEDDFGGNRFQAESESRPSLPSTGQHSLYFDHDTESLYNISQIVNGDYDAVNHAEHNYDPWFDNVQDPELARDPTTIDTDGRP